MSFASARYSFADLFIDVVSVSKYTASAVGCLMNGELEITPKTPIRDFNQLSGTYKQ
jgi:hypothetical protein